MIASKICAVLTLHTFQIQGPESLSLHCFHNCQQQTNEYRVTDNYLHHDNISFANTFEISSFFYEHKKHFVEKNVQHHWTF
mmetsp:Transcript_14840/g.19422  ORF Transcript_14840/g.19422 Transcript_14840/m.19422 type:complete len:81 (+) Transcript_14840:59-301(+)